MPSLLYAVTLALSSLRFHLKQPHRSMCMRRLSTDEIDIVPLPVFQAPGATESRRFNPSGANVLQSAFVPGRVNSTGTRPRALLSFKYWRAPGSR